MLSSADDSPPAAEAPAARSPGKLRGRAGGDGGDGAADAGDGRQATQFRVAALGEDAARALEGTAGRREFVAIADGAGAAPLFKVDALAVLERADGDRDGEGLAKLAALSNSLSFSVVAGNDVHILSEDCSEHRATITFECAVDFAALSGLSRFAAIGDSSGTLHFAHVAAGSVVFSQDLSGLAGLSEDSEKAFQWIGFAQRQTEETETLIVILANGTMVRFSNVDLRALDLAFEEMDMARANEIKAAIVVETLATNGDAAQFDQVNDVVYIPLGLKDERIVVGGRGATPLAVFRRSPLSKRTMLFDIVSMPSLEGDEVLRFCVDEFCGTPPYFLALYSSGLLAMIESRTLLILGVSDPLPGAYDVRMVSPGSAAVFIERNGAHSMEILELPSLLATQSLRLEGRCWTANVSAVPQGNEIHMQLCFLEHAEDRLVVRRLSEIAPLQKLASLVRARRWADAEALVAEYPGLDLASVLKAKVQDRVAESIWSQGAEAEGMLADLTRIPDPAFRVDACLGFLARSVADTYALLNYARDIAGVRVPEVYSALKRLGTFQLVTGSPGKQSGFDRATWSAFRSADLAGEMKALVAKGDIFRAIIIWRRHHIDDKLSESMADILAEMPEDALPGSYLHWLRDEVLPTVAIASERSRVASWIEKRARIVEQREGRPHTALEIIRLLDAEPESTRLDAAGPPTPATHVRRTIAMAQANGWSGSDDDFIGRVVAHGLKVQLKDMVTLWDDHDLKLSLADYSRETPQSIAIELLDRVAAPELLQSAVDEHFKPYAQANDLSCDELLTEYAAEIMENAGSASSLAGAPWEARVLALIGCMQSVEAKTETVLEVMRRAPVPWSDELDKTITEALAWPAVRRIDELREQYRLMQLKKMLLRYEITSFNVSDLSLATGLMRHILSRTDLTDVMDDAMQVVTAYHHLTKLDAFATRLRNLLAEEEHSRAITLLHTGSETSSLPVPDPREHVLTLADQESICGELLEWALCNMEEAVAFQDVTEEKGGRTYRVSLNAAIVVAENVAKHHASSNETSREPGYRGADRSREVLLRLPQFINLRSLFDDFGFMISPAEYHEDIRAVQNRLLGEMAREVFHYASGKRSEADRKPGKWSQNDLYRLAELLGVARDDLKGVMAEEAARCGDFRTVSLLCTEIIERGKEEKLGTTLRAVAARLVGYASQHGQVYRDSKDSIFSHRLTGEIKRLAQQAVMWCNAYDLPDALDAFKVHELSHAIFNQCDAGDYEALLIAETGDLPDAFFNVPSVGSSGSSSAPIIQALPAPRGTDEKPVGAADTYGRFLFEGHFYENGLVLDTVLTMELVSQFAMDALHLSAVVGNAKSKSKGSESRGPVASGMDLIGTLGRNQCRVLALQVWQRLLEHTTRKQNDQTVLESNVDDLGHRGYFDLVGSLLQTVLSTRHIDESLALGFMLCLPLEKAFEAFKAGMQSTGTEYHRLTKIALIGRAAGAAWSQRSFQLDCQQLGTNARWWQQLRLLEIPFDEAAYRASRGGEYQRQLVVPMLRKTSFDLLTVLDFTRAYNIEDDFVLLHYINLLMQHEDGSSYSWRVAAVVDDVVNKEKLLRLLLDRCFPSISPYDYERYQFLFSQIKRLDEKESLAKKGLLLLEILSGYQRTSVPSETELQEARKGLDDTSSFPLADSTHGPADLSSSATRRLPLRPFLQSESHFWPLLQAELSEETLPKLIPLTIPLAISPDRFYEAVIRKMAAAMGDARSQQRGDPNASPKHKFADFRPLLLKYREFSDALQMTAFIAGVFPCGPDRIQAYKTAQHLAEKWVQKLQASPTEEDKVQLDKATTAQSKIRHMLAATETEHQLRSLNLQPFLEFLQRPQELVVQLYSQKSADMVLHKDPIDLHAVVEDIARRHGIDVEKTRLKLLQAWLNQEVSVSKQDKETYLPSIRVQVSGCEKDSAHSVIRSSQMNYVAHWSAERSVQLQLLYLLKSQPVDKSVRDMLNIACQPSTKITTMTRIRALCVLFQFAGADEIGKVMSYDQIRNYLQMLLYLADFEELRIPQTIKEFTNCDKAALVRSLWLNHNGETKALQLICNVSMDFQLWDTTLWENVLHRLLKHGAYNYLTGILEHVSSVPELSQVKFLPMLWDKVVLGTLDSLPVSSTESVPVTSYLDVLRLIQKCPFLPQLSLPEIVARFAQLGGSEAPATHLLVAFRALVALPQSEQGDAALAGLLERADGAKLVKCLDLMDAARARTNAAQDFEPYDIIIRESVFDAIDTRRIYDCLAKSPQLLKLVNYLVDNRRAENMVLAVMKRGMLKEAQDIAALHFTRHGGTPETKEDILREYLEASFESLAQADRDFLEATLV
ncbi:rough deal protein C-terminal region-domain-containing protein [Hyaloraphidium curvatum]|nr:rough deal protein C-terminal region-domain-containing protein [Hyaloraphidium curvatum]